MLVATGREHLIAIRVSGEQAGTSTVGIVLAAVSLAVMPTLIWLKRLRGVGYRRVKVRWVTPLGEETASMS